MNSNQGKMYGYNNTQMGSGAIYNPTMVENFLPYNHQSMVCDSIQGKTSMKAESGLTYNLPVASRKRARDSMINNQINSSVIATTQKNNNNNLYDFSSVIADENLSLQLHQQQLEMDLIIAQHVSHCCFYFLIFAI